MTAPELVVTAIAGVLAVLMALAATVLVATALVTWSWALMVLIGLLAWLIAREVV